MSKVIERTWPEELLALGEARGEARGVLRARRDDLRALIEERFGALTQDAVDQIEAMDDADRLKSLVRRVPRADLGLG